MHFLQKEYNGKIVQIICFVALLSCLPTFAQTKKLLPEQYVAWGEMHTDKVSADGRWFSYSSGYSADTLYLAKVKTMDRFAFVGGNSSRFTDNKFFCNVPSGLAYVNLYTGKEGLIENATDFAYLPKSGLIAALENTVLGRRIILQKLDRDTVVKSIDSISSFSASPDSRFAAYVAMKGRSNLFGIIDMATGVVSEIYSIDPKSQIGRFVWHKDAGAITFMEHRPDRESVVHFYAIRNKKFCHISNSHPDLGIGQDIISHNSYDLTISDDMKKVFFATAPSIPPGAQPAAPQIWNGNDRYIYPMQRKRERLGVNVNLVAWWPAKDKARRVTEDSLSAYILTGGQDYAIVSDPDQYEPHFSYEAPRDFYIKNIASGEKSFLLEKHSANQLCTLPSPGGKYVSYFSNGHWWVYDISKHSHTNITLGLDVAFGHNENGMPGAPVPFGNPGWTPDDKQIIVYDQYDIWAFSPDGANWRRLTAGREDNVSIRISASASSSKPTLRRTLSTVYKIEDGLILISSNKNVSELYSYTGDGTIQKLYANDSFIDEIKILGADAFLYREQRFSLPPRIVIKTKDTVQIAFQSNPQHFCYEWGTSQLISYPGVDGTTLHGVLYYPAGYDPAKKYPMVVHIYQKQSQELHKYINPVRSYEVGFNVTDFTLEGYFVLCPDINYEIGNPGISAVKCVEAALTAAVENKCIDQSKIGLIGHSFGGYETNFIITHSKLFSAAVSGAGVSDMISFYLTVGWNTGRPDMWRFESQQWRMGKSIYDDWEAYHNNSPIRYAENVTTPLLLWAGKEDWQVDWHQSVEYHLALRRLKKANILLLYPDEGHTLTNNENQADLSERLRQWFGHFLKGNRSHWIEQGTKL